MPMKSEAEFLMQMLAQPDMRCMKSTLHNGVVVDCLEADRLGLGLHFEKICPRCKVKQRLEALTIDAQANQPKLPE